MRRLLGWVKTAIVSLIAVAVTVVLIYALQARRLPDLQPWLTQAPTLEVTATTLGDDATLAQYLERVPSQIKGGALLLHGLTDAPYSMRTMARTLFDRGYYVLALRIPGHGTVPAALERATWQDWMAATRLGARTVRAKVGADAPFVMVGYSNDGTLAVEHHLDAIDDPALPKANPS